MLLLLACIIVENQGLCVPVVSVVWTFIECEKDKVPPLSPFPTFFLPSGSFDHPSKSLFLVSGQVSFGFFLMECNEFVYGEIL